MDYEVAVFTASFEWYASPIIDKIDPSGNLIQHRFYRQHTQSIQIRDKEIYVKDLSIFKGVDLSKILIVDNSPCSFALNLQNGIPIVDFLRSKKDHELIKVMKYVRELAQSDNLMEANESHLHL